MQHIAIDAYYKEIQPIRPKRLVVLTGRGVGEHEYSELQPAVLAGPFANIETIRSILSQSAETATISRVWVLDEQPAHSTFAYFYFYNVLLLSFFAPSTHQHTAVCKVLLPLQS